MKVAIVHDYFNKKGGGERLALNLAEAFDADIFTGFVDSEKTYDITNYRVHELSKPIRNPVFKIITLHNKFKKLRLKGYDAVILIGTTSLAAAEHNHPNIWYCNTPVRHLYSQRDWFIKQISPLQRIVLRIFHYWLKPTDQRNVRQVDKIVCNSENIKDRIKRFYGETFYKNASVIYPPVMTNPFKAKSQKDFYLSFGRLDKLKRIPLIVDAFKDMPNKKLVVVSGGPELESIKRMSNGYKNIDIKGYVSHEELEELIGSCIATIYIPIDEDFGMSPLEGMAAGKPCIGVDEGGLKETIIHKKTGYLCDRDIKKEDLIQAVKWMNEAQAKKMRPVCIREAQRFHQEGFREKMQKEIQILIKKGI
ncbi:glycosyltransferase [Acidobacteriota bacterium]